MIQFEIDTSETEAGLIAVSNLGELMRPPIRKAIFDVAEIIKDDAAQSISKMVFPRSTAGQPPRQQTGRLLNSLKVKTAKGRATRGGERGYVIGAKFYARFLESGTQSTGKYGKGIDPRPFLVPARKRHIEDFRRIVQAALEKVIAKRLGSPQR